MAGVLALDGGRPDERLLRRMVETMRVGGPDGQAVRIEGPAGLGHALLRTADDVEEAPQPATLDGRVWLVADARIDARAELTRELELRGRRGLRDAGAAHLILHAYAVWGEACVDHLLGDFAFALWDGRAQRLFCARDHFGVKPFYYARVPGAFVFSNTLECVRLHPEVGSALDELAVADFLVFGFNQEPGTTIFAGIRRLPPAHSLACQEGAVQTRRYWSLPSDGRIRYQRAGDYLAHFTETLRAAVDDRLPAHGAGIWMSGGLDSTTIAATARRLLAERGTAARLLAHAMVYDTLIPDEERRYVSAAAEALALPVEFYEADAHPPFGGWTASRPRTCQPIDDPFLLLRLDQLRAASRTRVLLCGEGADEVLWRSDLLDLLHVMPPLELAGAVATSVLRYRQRPPLGLRARFARRTKLPPGRGFPRWLNPELERRLELRTRYDRFAQRDRRSTHPVRPGAFRRLGMASWAAYFEAWDPGATGVPVEARYPFFDVRLVTYLLAIPPLPWFANKRLLREAMRGLLPESVRLRPKTPLAAEPLRAHLRRGVRLPAPSQVSARFVDWMAVPEAGPEEEDSWQRARVLCFNHWLTAGAARPRGREGADADEADEGGRSAQEGVRETSAGHVR